MQCVSTKHKTCVGCTSSANVNIGVACNVWARSTRACVECTSSANVNIGVACNAWARNTRACVDGTSSAHVNIGVAWHAMHVTQEHAWSVQVQRTLTSPPTPPPPPNHWKRQKLHEPYGQISTRLLKQGWNMTPHFRKLEVWWNIFIRPDIHVFIGPALVGTCGWVPFSFQISHIAPQKERNTHTHWSLLLCNQLWPNMGPLPCTKNLRDPSPELKGGSHDDKPSLGSWKWYHGTSMT